MHLSIKYLIIEQSKTNQKCVKTLVIRFKLILKKSILVASCNIVEK
jgi:hypothetical protein